MIPLFNRFGFRRRKAWKPVSITDVLLAIVFFIILGVLVYFAHAADHY